MPRAYTLGRRQAAVDATARSSVGAGRELLRETANPSLAEVARRAGVSRVTVYNRFGSRENLLAALASRPAGTATPAPDGRSALQRHFEMTGSRWAADPALFRHLPPIDPPDGARRLAELLAAEDALRPGCSIREAEDVIATLSSFPVFDRLHRDGRR